MLIRGFSKALFSTWFHLPEVRAVFDAGEGINFFLGGRLTKVDSVFLTHGHTDHFTGLLNLLIARTRLSPRENSLPPVDLYYPEADTNLKLYTDYVQAHLRKNDFPEVARFHPVSPGNDYELPRLRKHFARVFPIKHGALPAVGYCVFETRNKVRSEYADRGPDEIGRLVAEAGRSTVLEPIEVPLVCYTGDSECAVEAPCQRPKVLFHEATFLTEEDRGDSNHVILSEAFESAQKLNPEELFLFHFSSRYEVEEITRALESQLEACPLESCKVSCALPGRLFVTEEGREELLILQ